MAKFEYSPNTGNWFKSESGELSGFWQAQSGEKLRIKITHADAETLEGIIGSCGSLKLGKPDSNGSRIGELIENTGNIVRVRSVPHRKDGRVRNVFLHALTNSAPQEMGAGDY